MIYLYQIECLTPNHFYVGLSSQLDHRLQQHENGQGAKFTKIHGVKSVIIVETFNDENLAKKSEWSLVLSLRGKGHVVAGAGSTQTKL